MQVAIICLLSLCCVLLLGTAAASSRSERRLARLKQAAADWRRASADLTRRLNAQASRHADEMASVLDENDWLRRNALNAEAHLQRAIAALHTDASDCPPQADEEE